MRSFCQENGKPQFRERKTETGAVQRNVNFVGLENCCKMSIYSSGKDWFLIQRRTSDLIFIISLASRDLIFTERSYPLLVTWLVLPR